MLNGLNSLRLSLKSLNTRVKKMLLMMHCLIAILCFHNLTFKIFGLETIKDQYVHDADFKDVLKNCNKGRICNKFVVNDGFVFRANKLCILASSVRLL